MRTKNERLHNNEVAVQKKLKIAIHAGYTSNDCAAIHQPGRLSKTSLMDLQNSSHISSNPRNQSINEKDKMTVAEQSNENRWKHIELVELSETIEMNRHAANEMYYTVDAVPSSSHMG